MAIECVTSISVILGSTPSLLLRQWIFYTTNFHTKYNVAMFSVTSKKNNWDVNSLKQLPQFYKKYLKVGYDLSYFYFRYPFIIKPLNQFPILLLKNWESSSVVEHVYWINFRVFGYNLSYF